MLCRILLILLVIAAAGISAALTVAFAVYLRFLRILDSLKEDVR